MKPRDREPHIFAQRIPGDFTVGVATAAFQIEGAVDEDGRGPSTWDSFMTQPGRILDGSTAAVADDHYHRYREDVKLIRELGVDSYRFSLAWPRIQPGGSGQASAQGIAFYDRLLDELLGAGISPMATLFHWDTPEPLQAAGGWMNRETALRFGDFALLAAEAFGDRVDKWVTINEPATVTLNGYALGLHAPGNALLFDSLPSVHHQLLGHGLAVQALRSAKVLGGVGVTNVHSPVVPSRNRISDRFFTRVFDHLHNRIFADPVLLGKYPTPPFGARRLFRALTEADSDDLQVIHQPLDFYGLNYYMPTKIQAGTPTTTETPDGDAPAMKDVPFTIMPWLDREQTGFGWPVAPDYLEVTLTELSQRYGDALPPIYITEGGASFPDEGNPAGEFNDDARRRYLADHLAVALQGAPGVEVAGYYVWSLLDNWEWAAGYTQRFGLVHVDFATLVRTPKSSYWWLQQVLSNR